MVQVRIAAGVHEMLAAAAEAARAHTLSLVGSTLAVAPSTSAPAAPDQACWADEEASPSSHAAAPAAGTGCGSSPLFAAGPHSWQQVLAHARGPAQFLGASAAVVSEQEAGFVVAEHFRLPPSSLPWLASPQCRLDRAALLVHAQQACLVRAASGFVSMVSVRSCCLLIQL